MTGPKRNYDVFLFSVKVFVILVRCGWRGGLVDSFTWLVCGGKTAG